MQERSDLSPIVNIMELAHEIIDTCPECTGRASEIIVWAEQIRERRPSREELAALIDVTCPGGSDRNTTCQPHRGPSCLRAVRRVTGTKDV